MNYALVWILVTGIYSGSGLTYSPPLKTREDCQRIQAQVSRGVCVQVNVLVRGQ